MIGIVALLVMQPWKNNNQYGNVGTPAPTPVVTANDPSLIPSMDGYVATPAPTIATVAPTDPGLIATTIEAIVPVTTSTTVMTTTTTTTTATTVAATKPVTTTTMMTATTAMAVEATMPAMVSTMMTATTGTMFSTIGTTFFGGTMPADDDGGDGED